MHALTRTLAATLAILALAAPAAFARIDPPANAAGPSQRTEDLRHLGAGAAAPQPGAGRVYWSYDYQAPKPAAHPVAPASVPATTPDDGTPWLTLGFALAGACLLVSAAAVAVSRRPRGAGIA
jgi:hypothetical protein